MLVFIIQIAKANVLPDQVKPGLSTALIWVVRGRQSVNELSPRNPVQAGWKFRAIQILTEKIIYAEISFLLY